MSSSTDGAGRFIDAEHEIVVVGAGFAGMYALYRLRSLGYDVKVIEAGHGVGGVWYWNRYPGARCDIPSLYYSYSFSEELQQDWEWTERYPSQPEIERYANHVADRFDLRRDIFFGTRVIGAEWLSAKSRWLVTTDRGSIEAKYFIMATGGYSAPIIPQIDALDEFEGEIYYTHHWPERSPTLAGKRVAVVGTGSSGMQVSSAVAKMGVEHLYVLQRTANYVIPAKNRVLSRDEVANFKRDYADHRRRARNSPLGVDWPTGSGRTMDLSDEEFQQRFEAAWVEGGPAILSAFPDFLVDADANGRLADAVRAQVGMRVKDADTAAALSARGHYIGSRRILIDTDYFEAFNQDNVSLVNLKIEPLIGMTTTGVKTANREIALDVLILATGFDSGSGPVLRLNLKGKGGQGIVEHWQAGPRTFLGMTVSGFPNFFMVSGPGSPALRSQAILMGESQVDWLADLLQHMSRVGATVVNTSERAEDDWTQHVADVANSSLCVVDDTQYVGVNVPGKPRVFATYIGGFNTYDGICAKVRDAGFEGLLFDDEPDDFDRGQWHAPQVGRQIGAI